MLRGNIQKKTKHYQVTNPERTVTPVWKGLRKILESSYIVKTKNLKIKPPKKEKLNYSVFLSYYSSAMTVADPEYVLF